MDDRRALVAAIIANPEEDTPRLALADWLQEHGDKHDRARAEFIRLQIRLAPLPEDDAARKKLETRANKLADTHRVEWLKPLAPFQGTVFNPQPPDITFSRGLVKYLMVGTGEFLQKANQKAIPDALATVGVENLHFYSATARAAALAASPAIRWTAGLSYPGPDDAALAAFSASPEWAHLTTLEFDEVNATDAGLTAFAKASGTTRLTAFGVAPGGGMSNPKGKYTVAGVLAILDSDRFPLLRSLDLEAGQSVKFDWKTFFAADALKRLVRLRLPGAPMAAVAACRHLTALHELAINSAHITDPDVEVLLANPAFAKLTKLEMYGTNWGRPRLSKPVEQRLRDRFGAEALAYSPEER